MGGGIVKALDAGFTEVHSIELSSSLYDYCVKRFEGNPNVHMHHGDSATFIASLLPEITGQVTFWLDGTHSMPPDMLT